jgi:hypothetical protein
MIPRWLIVSAVVVFVIFLLNALGVVHIHGSVGL